MTANMPGTDRVPDRVIVERIRPYLRDVPAEKLLGLVRGTHEIVEREPINDMTLAPKDGTEIRIPIHWTLPAFWCNDLKRWVLSRPLHVESVYDVKGWLPGRQIKMGDDE